MKTHPRILTSLLTAFAISGAASAATQTWSGATDQNWGTATNWSTGVPTTGDTASFSASSPSQTTVIMNENYTLDYGANTPSNLLLFNSAHSYTINGPGTLTLTSSNGTATDVLRINTGGNGTTQTFNANLIWNMAGASQRIITYGNSHFVFNGSLTFQKSGTVRLHDLTSSATFNGAVSVASGMKAYLYGGTINLNNSMSGPGSVSLQGSARNTLVVLNNGSGAAFGSTLYSATLGATTSTGYTTTVRQDANNQIAALTSFGEATWDLNGHSNTNTKELDLISTDSNLFSSIDFSDAAAESLWFANSSGQGWTSQGKLNLIGFSFGTDALRFGTDATGLISGQLSQIYLNGVAGSGLSLDSNGYLVPEPTTWLLMGVAATFFVVFRRRRLARA